MQIQPITVSLPAQAKSYDLVFPESFDDLSQVLHQQLKNSRSLIITDKNVPDYTDQWDVWKSSDTHVLALPLGEERKCWDTVELMLNACFEQNLDRSSTIIAVGGGILGDMAGFAAAIFLRGISFIQIPTSLLAMVDSSIGGKTGINCAYGKNLIGAIYQPQSILCCKAFLDTLPEAEIKNGLCEMIKHGILGDVKHFEDLERIASPHPTAEEVFPLVPDSMRVKIGKVQEDEREAQARMHLNLGHTFGHAIELLYKFKIPHGRAVAIGTCMAADFALEQGLCDKTTHQRINNIFRKYDIDLSCDFSDSAIRKAMQHDKKRRGDEILLILPTKIGEVVIYPVKIKDFCF